MKATLLAPLAVSLTFAGANVRAQSTAPVNQGDQAQQESKAVVPAAGSQMGEVAVGGILSIQLPCNPTTGFKWEVKSINRRIAVSTGTAEFQESPAVPGRLGVGGTCVLRIKGVKPGKTKAVFVYRRPWEKVAPAKTSVAEITVLPK